MIYQIKKKIAYTCILAIVMCLVSVVMTCGNAYAADPVLFYSDLVWGPKTGWENSSTKGAAVTIWGENFGSAVASSKVTVNGADITATDSAYIAEWNATGPARSMSRITFWVPSTAADGAGTISVTVNGVTSNTLSFTVASGTIYFISVSDGSNSYNGRYATRTGHTGSDGPFRDIYMFNPGLDSAHSASTRNPSGDAQYIAYVRGGTYTTEDVDSAALAFRGPYGGPTKQKALIGYPGENATVDTASLTRGVVWYANYDPYGKVSYLTISKINAKNGGTPMGVFGDYNRIVGCTFYDYLLYAQSGLVQVTNSQHTSLFGNYLYHSGNDSMKHGYYIKTEYTGQTSGDRSTLYTDIGWNEFYNFVSSDHHGGIIFVSKSGDSQIAQYPTAYTYIHDNYFHDNDMECLYVGDGVAIGDVYFYNNVCASGTSSNGGMTFYNGTNNVYIYNNTFYQVAGTSGSEFWGTGSTTNVVMKNNIFYATPNNPFVYWEGSTGATLNSTNDLYYSSTGASVPSGSRITVTSAKSGNPLFTSSTNYHLQSGSPAIDQGVSTVSSVVTKDYDGIARPQNSVYDIGAFEVSGSAPQPSTYTVGGSISGLNGTVVIQNNGTDTLSRSVNGSFTFTTELSDNAAYDVRVQTQPTGQTCTVSNGSGNIPSADVTSVSITCTNNPGPTYTIGGQISGLSGTVAVQNNGGNTLSISANGTFTFSTALSDGATYAVTILTQPSGQRCTVTSGTGTVSGANVTSVRIACVNTYTVGGSISGLSGGTVTLQNNSTDTLARNVNGSFTFGTALTNAATYSVAVTTNPTGQTCTISNGSGTVSGANITTVSVTCVTNTTPTKTPSTVGGVTVR
jgi:hypothetical protein